jgi:hypothetical protein
MNNHCVESHEISLKIPDIHPLVYEYIINMRRTVVELVYLGIFEPKFENNKIKDQDPEIESLVTVSLN